MGVRNVILMAMSVIHDRQKKASFCFQIEPQNAFSHLKSREVTDCVSQLEPIARLLLENEPDTDTDMIILGTDITRCPERRMDPDVSATDFFADRIRLKEGAACFSKVEIYGEDAEAKTYEIRGAAKNRTVRFFDIRIKEREPLFGIGRAVEIIRAAHNVGLGQFWIAANGGLRDSYLSMNAIVSLLRNEKIIPDCIMSTEFNSVQENANAGVHKIFDASPAFDIFMFVSGINEFVRFGTVDTLAEYYSTQDIEKKDKVLDAMSRIALGNKLNAVFMYEQGIQILASQFQGDSPHKSKVMKRNEFQIFKNEIESDYGNLLSKEGYSYIDIVERSYRKKMYQQALTIIESKMNEDYFQEGLLVYDENNIELKSNIRQKKKEDKRAYEEDSHYIVDQFLLSLGWLEQDGFNDDEAAKQVILEFMIDKDLFLAYAKSHGTGQVSDSGISYSFSDQMRIDRLDLTLESFRLDETTRDRFGYLLRAHKAIKKVRNMISHGNWNVLRKVNESYNKRKNGAGDGKRLSDHEGIEIILDSLLEVYISLYDSIIEL